MDYPDYSRSGWSNALGWFAGWLGLAAVLAGLTLLLTFVFSLL
jgi:hypothetical protein